MKAIIFLGLMVGILISTFAVKNISVKEKQKNIAANDTSYFACSSAHGLTWGYCKEFNTYEEAVAELERHKKSYPNHTDVTASGGKCPF